MSNLYAFQGMEKDDENKGDGNSYTTEFRQYDPRLGNWLSLDPLMAKYPHQSPYAAFNNNPLFYRDPKGLEGESTGDKGGDIKSRSKKELRGIKKSIKDVKQASNKLSRQEHREAKQFKRENGGKIDEWEDSNGNKRYGVVGYDSDKKFEEVTVQYKTFNAGKWSELQTERDGIVSTFSNLIGVPNFLGNGLGGPIDVVGVSIGYSYTHGITTMRVYSEYDAILFITRGRDFGLWKSHTSGKKYGLQYEYSANIFVGKYWGSTNSLTAGTLEGAGWDLGVDLAGGASIWGSFKGDTWIPGWTGAQVGVGPAAGGSVGPTQTTLRRY